MIGLWIVTYDVRDNRRRYRVARVLAGHGERVQRSVFECHLGPRHASELMARLHSLMDPRHDKVALVPLCTHDQRLRFVLGRGAPTASAKFRIL